jgi:ribonuclease P protein component
LDNILKKEKDFNKVFKSGKRAFSDTVTLYYLPSTEFKVGFAVSKKHGTSVKRNRIKRLLREAFRSFSFENYPEFFFVILPKINEDYTLDGFKKGLSKVFKKIGVI